MPNPVQPTQGAEEVQPDSRCQENDGCPTEKSVLQRFWREHQKVKVQSPSLQEKTQINKRLAARYDFLMERHQHGHYETMFRCVHEELALQRAALSPVPPEQSDEDAARAFLNSLPMGDGTEPLEDAVNRLSIFLARERKTVRHD